MKHLNEFLNEAKEEDMYFSNGKKVKAGKYILDGSSSDIDIFVYKGKEKVGQVYFDADDNGFWTTGDGSNILVGKKGGSTWYNSIQEIVDFLKTGIPPQR